MINKTNLILLLLLIGLLSACNDSSQQHIPDNQISLVENIPTKTITELDKVVYDEFIFPGDTNYTTKLLSVGIFHNDEVWEDASALNWFGLFKGGLGYYLKETKISTTNVYDPILDENESVKTGWEVEAINEDTCLILIEPLPFFTERPVEGVKLSKTYIYPGDTVSFQYLGIDYKIFATGGKKKVQEDPEWFEVWNFKLYIIATIKGKQHKSLLVSQPNFDDQMINLIFAGDIDGDGILDLIIDTSSHYNATSPTIYLSRPAENGEIVKPIGVHTSVGC